jgi:putative flippase GtrA
MEAMLARIADVLPGPVGRFARARAALAAQFLRFGVVGLAGFAVDAAAFYALWAALGFYGARALSYLAAASTTWALNRAWTFRGAGSGRVWRQWGRFVVLNLAGFVLNYGTSALLYEHVALCRAYPVLAIFAGALAGMTANFTLARAVVFR